MILANENASVRWLRGYAMDRVKIDLKNCYGIKELRTELDFTKTPAYAIYAPNGVMKSSLAQTFKDAANGENSQIPFSRAKLLG